ncbi:MAG: cytosolic protein [Nevskia sp.]|nr:cytosolic protein [Nevskia sp.]
MAQLDFEAVQAYVEENVKKFHEVRLAKLKELTLDDLLRRKNPYLFRSKYLETAPEFVRALIDDHVSSAGETQFGNFLEMVAIFVCRQVFGGRKSTTRGIDLEFDRDGYRNIVAIKSGPNWGNASQIAKMRADFKDAAKTLRTSHSGLNVKAINGCCYGRDDNPDKGDYWKLCGQRFWNYISGSDSLYLDLIKPLAHEADRRSLAFRDEYARKVNLLTTDFGKRFCTTGRIDWDALVRFNSAARAKR